MKTRFTRKDSDATKPQQHPRSGERDQINSAWTDLPWQARLILKGLKEKRLSKRNGASRADDSARLQKE